MRGENLSSDMAFFARSETSPRAWRKQGVRHGILNGGRNISTCVEKTPFLYLRSSLKTKHLHVRGENTTESGLFTLYMRYIESIHAIFVKEQNNLLVFPLSYQTFDLFLGQQRKQR